MIGSTRFQYTLPGFYNDNTWRHVGWIFNPDGTWNIYINGMLMQQLQAKGYPNSMQRSFNFLGRSNWVHDPYFSGAISDFRLYNRVLGAAEISSLYSGTPTALPTARQTFITTAPPTAPPTSLPIATAWPTPTPTSISTDKPTFPTTSPTSPEQSSDSSLMLYYSFAPDTITGNVVSNMAAAQFAGIFGVLQMGPTLTND